jgi:hypothetical protein
MGAGLRHRRPGRGGKAHISIPHLPIHLLLAADGDDAAATQFFVMCPADLLHLAGR